jgi:hypothetical protein
MPQTRSRGKMVETKAVEEADGSGEHDTTARIVTHYFPPARQLLGKLDITATDLMADRVTVDGAGLRRLIAEYARGFPFDAAWYGHANPDVEGARLAGDILSLHEHFVRSGYLEGRLPHRLPFDPVWYHGFYKDISVSFEIDNVAGMRRHFETGGFAEGRAGCEAMLADAESWRAT